MAIQGFFGKIEKAETRASSSKVSLTCPCGLHKTCLGPMMSVGGAGRKEILVIAEAPGKTEDEAYQVQLRKRKENAKGTQLIGEAGKRLQKELAKFDIDLHKDCWKMNAVNCRPPKNRAPTGLEIDACRPRVMAAIKELRPKYILAMGSAALQSLFHFRVPKKKRWPIGLYRGMKIPDQELNAFVFPIQHSSYIIRQERSGKDPGTPLWFEKDIENFAKAVEQNEVFPIQEKPIIEILSEKEAIRTLTMMMRKDNLPVAFDYETTGLKPYARGHEIVCVSLCQAPGYVSYVFEMTSFLQEKMKEFLQSPVPKVAQHCQFEEMWSRGILGTEVNNWHWDTMLASHALDNRGGVSGLKFQTFANFGIANYSQEIEPYLEAVTSLGLNNIFNAPRKKLLHYCGEDSWYEMKLFQKQEKSMPKHMKKGMALLMQGAQALMDDEENGMIVNRSYIREQKGVLSERISNLKSEILDSKEGRIWSNKHIEPNLGSNSQLADILYNELKITPEKETKKGNPSVDEETLGKIALQYPFVNQIVQLRKLEKIHGTYLSGWEKETSEDGIMRPFYHLEVARTFRSSCSNPNLQNVPIRDEEAQAITRRAIYPRLEHYLVEVDYSGIEVRVGACYHKDPQMLTYINDPTTDMHRDMAIECYLLEEEEVSKSARQGSKNQFVFPEFYGSYYGNTGPGLWDWADTCKTAQGIPLKKHLKSKGLGNIDRFVSHIKKVEKRFWGERFRGYADWKEEFWQEYLEKGYFDTLTGFRCSGPMRFNEVVNYPIQGSAFHCLLFSKYNTKRWIEMNESKILPVGQIHDSGLFSVPEKELDRFVSVLPKIWCIELKRKWHWIIVPLEIEIDVTPLNGSWFEKKKYTA